MIDRAEFIAILVPVSSLNWMSQTMRSAADEFAWEIQPAAACWLRQSIESLAARNPVIHRLATVLREQTGTRLADWVDHLALDTGANDALRRDLAAVGYAVDATGDGGTWRHPLGLFPPVRAGAGRIGLALRVDRVDDCLAALPAVLGLSSTGDDEITGQRGGPFRQASLHTESGVAIWVVERHGYQGLARPHPEASQISAAARHLETFRTRKRAFEATDDGFLHASRLIAAAASDLGTGWAWDLFFRAEREYWQSRNAAGRVQYQRQNHLGFGWANHDHHTYRSSRLAFRHLIATLEQRGFECRERFYAGREAGWGAQLLEQPDCRIVIFADVDLAPEEVAGDFAHEPLAERDELGTVGLWCELHGEAFLEAGMHHLACQFDFDAARVQLAAAGVETLAPFTDFPFLKQAFTRGETWPVNARRVDRLLDAGRITAEQADRFRCDGAIGSHMEILERNDGYKGFNQTGISEIIARTDPRQMIGA